MLFRSYYTHVDLSENGTGLFTFSNPWDFDHAFYQYGTLKYQDPEKFFASQRTMWYVMLLNNAFIREKVVEYWNQICDDTNNFEAATEMLRTVTMSYTADFDADAELWSREKNRLQECATVYTWLETRIKWLDAQFNDPNYVK